MNRNLCLAAFAVGLVAVIWVGLGYIGAHPLALSMTTLIGIVYVFGAMELRRFHAATVSLAEALQAIPEPLANLGDWLAGIHPSLQNAVRLRVEGERVSLPGPAVTPYLVGLLVMLGMLGTFLGMVVTLNGAVLALETTTDLPTIRAALAAPVKGLGLAFGTSVAGVAASAMLGLVSSLCRRERLQAGQMLETRIATVLRGFSLAHQREQAYRALQAQAGALPTVVEQLQAMMTRMEETNHRLDERLVANQEDFHRQAKGAYVELAASVDRSLRASLAESAQAAGAAIQPAVAETMAGIARETSALHERVAAGVAAQLDGLSARFDSAVTHVAETWTAALAQQEQQGAEQASRLHQALDGFAESFAQRAAALIAGLGEAHAVLQADQMRQDAERMAALGASLEAMAGSLRQEWQQAGAGMQAQQQQICAVLEQSAQTIHANAQAQAEAVIDRIARASEVAAEAPRAATGLIEQLRQWQDDQAVRDVQRQAALTQALESLAASLQQEWRQSGVQTLAQQQAICQTLEQTARSMTSQAQTHAIATIDEISRLMQTAAEAPRVAAEVIGELRKQLTQSVARDNELLEERSRVMETLNALLDTINHASVEQRTAIDALVTSSGAMLERIGSQFAEQVGSESAKLVDAAAQMTGASVEAASLGDAFGAAVQQFGEANEKMIGSLQRIETALGQSLVRSDEQLAYYVAQARELIDLTLLSQKQIVAELQQRVGQGAATGAA